MSFLNMDNPKKNNPKLDMPAKGKPRPCPGLSTVQDGAWTKKAPGEDKPGRFHSQLIHIEQNQV
jgi:hypothetical protein